MKIVIDIDDDMYKSVANNDAYVLGDVDWILLENAIANGTPLPEHHGRIIDESKIRNIECRTEPQLYGDRIYYVKTTDAPTIIEGSDSE